MNYILLHELNWNHALEQQIGITGDYLVVALRRRVMQRRIANAEGGVPGEAGIVLQEGLSFLEITIPRRGDETLPGGRAPKGITHYAQKPHNHPNPRNWAGGRIKP